MNKKSLLAGIILGIAVVVSPCFALLKPHDESDLREVNSEFSGQPPIAIDSRFVKFSDSAHLLPRELGIAVLFTTASHLPSLPVPVQIIVHLRSQEQMFRIGAWRIVARVQHALAHWNGATVEHPRNTMGMAVINDAIARAIASGEPSPAQAKSGIMAMNWPTHVHLDPKALRQCFGKTLRSQICSGNFRSHPVSNVIVCQASDWFPPVRGQLRLESQAVEGFAI